MKDYRLEYTVWWSYLKRRRGRRTWRELGDRRHGADVFRTRAAAEAACRRLERNASRTVITHVLAEIERTSWGRPKTRRAR